MGDGVLDGVVHVVSDVVLETCPRDWDVEMVSHRGARPQSGEEEVCAVNLEVLLDGDPHAERVPGVLIDRELNVVFRRIWGERRGTRRRIDVPAEKAWVRSMSVRESVHARNELETSHIEYPVEVGIASARGLIHWARHKFFMGDTEDLDRDLVILLNSSARAMTKRQLALEIKSHAEISPSLNVDRNAIFLNVVILPGCYVLTENAFNVTGVRIDHRA